jgi:uncharacterized membrane protein required for colicin V production
LIEDNPKIVWLVIGAVIVAGALSAGVIGYFVAQIPQPPNSRLIGGPVFLIALLIFVPTTNHIDHDQHNFARRLPINRLTGL